MSVMPETSHSEMRPWSSIAAFLSALYSPTAFFSLAFFVKTFDANRRPLIVGTGMLAARSDERGKCAV
eukprot:scaffold46715_cov51-Phaeocystis_antarctica.AAC.1